MIQACLKFFNLKSYLLSESISKSIISSLTFLFLALINFTSGSFVSSLTPLSFGSSDFTYEYTIYS